MTKAKAIKKLKRKRLGKRFEKTMANIDHAIAEIKKMGKVKFVFDDSSLRRKEKPDANT